MIHNYLNILAETIRNNWDKLALTDFYLTEDGSAQDTSRGNHYTYGEMYAEIVRVADMLTRLGLQKGDHIAICGTNSAHWVIAYLAIARIQGVSVTVLHSLQPDEIARLINFSDAKALFVDRELWPELKDQTLPHVESVICMEEWSILKGNKEIIINYQLQITNDQCQFAHGNPDELATICFTSGTMTKPKGVMLSYKNINSNLIDIDKFYRYRNSSYVSFLPLSHMYGLVVEYLLPLCVGINVNILQISLQQQLVKQILDLLKPQVIIVVPSLIGAMLKNQQDVDAAIRDVFGSVRALSFGGASLPEHIECGIIKNGIGIAMGYGMTECSPRITYSSPEQYKKGSVGIPLSCNKVSIDRYGEILVKGENVMLGYYKDPEATAAKIEKDGWLHTGDKGHLDEDGYLYVEGRLEQDIIVLPNGENIRPDNIEALINALPEVKESIVLARDGKLVARVVVPPSLLGEGKGVRLSVLRTVNPLLPLFSQLYDVEITDQPLQRTEKQTIKRYLYK